MAELPVLCSCFKNSGSNDTVHHIVFAYRHNTTFSSNTPGFYFQLSDGVTNQCCVCIRSDGAIILTSATPNGTTLATYTGAVSAQSTWFAFECEVVIHPTAGSFKVRKNGNTVDDHSTTNINTRPGANTYANRLTVGLYTNPGGTSPFTFDDVPWRSDTAAVPWVGDIRCYTRMPARLMPARSFPGR